MPAKNITNNHDRTLNVGGVDIGPGKTARVQNWEKHDRSNAVMAWMRAGVISVGDAGGNVPALPGMPGLPGTDEDAQKTAAIEELAKYGIERTKRTSLASLQEQLAEAKAKAEAGK